MLNSIFLDWVKLIELVGFGLVFLFALILLGINILITLKRRIEELWD